MKYHILRLVMASLVPILLMAACDDDSSNTSSTDVPDSITLTKTVVTYDASTSVLVAQITARVLDKDGNPVEGAELSLTLEGATGLPNAATDASGMASLTVRSAEIATVDGTLFAQKYTGENPNSISIPVSIDFDYSADTAYSSPIFGGGQACRTVTITLSDDSGPIAGQPVVLTYTSDPTSDMPLHTVDATTDESGTFATQLCASENLNYYMTLSLGSLPPKKLPKLTISGPPIAGEITSVQTYHDISAPRAGVLVIDGSALSAFEEEGILIQELQSMGFGGCPADGSGSFFFTLPPAPPDEYLTKSDGDVRYGIFPVFMYDDLDGSESWNPGEPITAIRLHGGIPVYFKGPDGEGWILPDSLEDDATMLDWEPNAEHLDLTVTMAPVYSPVIKGLADLGDMDIDPQSVTAAMLALDSQYMADNGLEATLQNGKYLVTLQSTLSATAYISMDATSLEAAIGTETVEQMTLTDDGMTYIILLPVLYLDSNSNGTPEPAEIIGGGYGPFGTNAWFIYEISFPDWFALWQSGDRIFFHKGYNYVTENRELNIDSVHDATTWQLNEGLEPGHTDVPFEVYDNHDSMVAEGTFSTATQNASSIVTITDCTGCEHVVSGDTFVIKVQEDDFLFREWTEPIYFKVYSSH